MCDKYTTHFLVMPTEEFSQTPADDVKSWLALFQRFDKPSFSYLFFTLCFMYWASYETYNAMEELKAEHAASYWY